MVLRPQPQLESRSKVSSWSAPDAYTAFRFVFNQLPSEMYYLVLRSPFIASWYDMAADRQTYRPKAFVPISRHVVSNFYVYIHFPAKHGRSVATPSIMRSNKKKRRKMWQVYKIIVLHPPCLKLLIQVFCKPRSLQLDEVGIVMRTLHGGKTSPVFITVSYCPYCNATTFVILHNSFSLSAVSAAELDEKLSTQTSSA